MSAPGYHFRPLPRSFAPAEAWRPLDRAVARWTAIHGGSPLLAELAGWASFADGQGDAALALAGPDAGRHGTKALEAAQIRALRQQGLVCVADAHGHAPGDAPFVLDGERFYLRRNHRHEVAVAARLAQRLENAPAAATPVDEADLDALFHHDAGPEVRAQRQAVKAAAGTRLFVLTGGPGTGKTTTVLRMLAMLARQHAAQGRAAPAIRIAAPTGKAAQRLAHSLRDGAANLLGHDRHPLPERWKPWLETALSASASTLHRLLGSLGRAGGFRFHAGHRLPADIVVVDEASMLDLDLLHALLDALREDAVLILVGDADQLTSVGTGSVMLDLVAALEARGAPQLVRLRHSFRAVAPLVAVNRAILDGDAARLREAWQAADDHVHWREVAALPELRAALADWCRQLHAQLRDIGALGAVSPRDPERALHALDGLRRRQLLCALREGGFGADAIGAAIDLALRRRIAADEQDAWYPGRAVMIVQNDYASGLFNGDIGLCLRDERGRLGVWFEVGDPSAQDADAAPRRAVRFAPGSLPEHRGAFAITVHKSQGSEYGRVAVLLPPDPGNRILSRQLLYTGVSRARESVELWGTRAALDAALAAPIRRTGGLARRLA